MRAVAVAITSSAVVGPLVASLMGSNRMEASEGESAEMTKLAGMLGEFNSMSTGKVLLVSRFGRARMDRACTWRALTQVFGRYPSEKYTFGLPSLTRRSR
jgi:hypothetical protein